MTLSLREKLRRFTPARCRLLARKKPKTGSNSVDMTDEEIARASGLTLADVKALSYARTWNEVPVAKMLAFARGCGLDLDDAYALKKGWALWNNGRARHVKRSPRRGVYAEISKEA